jgi:branched-chain amino acid transport system substrate-binding protein
MHLLTKNSLWRAVAAGLVLGGLSISCSGPAADARQTRLSCNAPGVSDSEIRAGLLFSDSGAAASAFGAFRSGVDARLGVANAAGGVNGRKVVYRWQDDATDPARNLLGARDLVNSGGVFGVIEGSTVAAGSAQYLDDQKVPVVGLAAEIAWTQHPNMFAWSYYTTQRGSTSVWGEYIRNQGGSRVALIGTALSDAIRDFHRQVAASLQAAGNSIVLAADVTPGSTNFDALVQQMKADRVDTIAGAVFPDVLARILPAARAAGINIKVVLVPLGYDPRLLRTIGPALAGTVIYLDFVPFELNTPAHTRMLAAMRTYALQNRSPEQESTAFGWLSADIFLRGLQAAGPCPTRQAFTDGLRAVHNYDGDGLLPAPVDFATNRGLLSECYDFVRVSDDGSRFVPLEPATRCGTRLD